MFTKICLTLALGVSAAQSLSVDAPSSVTSGGQTTITWSSISSDPTFSIELIHPSFNNAFAIANSVDPTANTLTLTIPSVPADYTSSSFEIPRGSFAIGAEASASDSSSSTATSNSSASATGESGSGSVRPTSTAPSSSASGSAPSSGTGAPSSAARAGTLPAAAAAIVALIGAAFAL
ncbi:hypothetical protein DFH09DRAFT_1397946 [Mycena vulgaris]|nr:hypothetical protein DFH09DRAFT_1397946 [Mycena vulgaris]